MDRGKASAFRVYLDLIVATTYYTENLCFLLLQSTSDQNPTRRRKGIIVFDSIGGPTLIKIRIALAWS